MSSNEEPEVILERVSFEWVRIGGVCLSVKEISSFATKASVTLSHVRNNSKHSLIIPELKCMLEEARERELWKTWRISLA